MAERLIPKRITLVSDPEGWVEFHDPQDLTGEEFQRAINNVTDGSNMAMGMTVLYSMAETLISAWHIPYSPRGSGYAAGTVPIPAERPGILAKLRMNDYALIVGTATPVTRLLNGINNVTVDDAAVPGSPTVPSGG